MKVVAIIRANGFPAAPGQRRPTYSFGLARASKEGSLCGTLSRASERHFAAEWMPITDVRVLIGIFFFISGGRKLLVPAHFSLMEQFA